MRGASAELKNDGCQLFPQESKEYTLSLGRNSKLRRKLYSESEEYDTDTSGEGANAASAGGGHARGLGGRLAETSNLHPNGVNTPPVATRPLAASVAQQQQLFNNQQQQQPSQGYNGYRFRQQYNL